MNVNFLQRHIMFGLWKIIVSLLSSLNNRLRNSFFYMCSVFFFFLSNNSVDVNLRTQFYVFPFLCLHIHMRHSPILLHLYLFQADNIPESGRSTAFGIISGIGSAAFVCATLSARFLSTAQTFQVLEIKSI